MLNSFKKFSVNKRVGEQMESDRRISLPGLTTLKIAKNTDPKPVGAKKT